MFNIWFFIWFLVSICILGFAGWTVLTVQQQKRTWRGFADKYKLRFKPSAFLQTPDVSGTVEGYTVSLFSGEHVAEDFRGTRKLSALEVKLSSVMPFEGAIGSGGMVSVIRQLDFKEELKPAHESWNTSFIAASNNRSSLELYLTPARLAALTDLMRIKNGWVILIFRGDMLLLRLDTADPLTDMAKLEKLLQKMLEAARVLELTPGEEARLKAAEGARPAAGTVTLQDIARDEAGLQLED